MKKVYVLLLTALVILSAFIVVQAQNNDQSTKVTEAPVVAPAETKTTAEEKKTEPPPAPAGVPGILQIAGKPPCNVSINGKSYGTTPKKIEMPANAYTIRCVNEEQGIDNEQSVTLGAGEVKKVMFK